MVKVLIKQAWQQRFESIMFLILASFALAVTLSLWGPWSANAAVTEATLTDFPSTTGKTTVPSGGMSIPVLKFTLTPDAPDRFSSTSFTILNVSNFTKGDLATGGPGPAVFLIEDVNRNNAYDDGTDTYLGGLNGGPSLNVGSTTTIDIDLNSGADGYQTSIVTTTPYLLMFIMSTTSTEGHAFQVKMSNGTTTHISTSTLITSAGITSGVITIDNTKPTVVTKMPPTGQQFVPVDALLKQTFSENLATSSVTTTISGSTTSTVLLQKNNGNTEAGAAQGPNLCTSVTLDVSKTINCAHESLTASTWYTFSVAGGMNGITDIADNILLVTSTAVFKTGDIVASTNVTPPAVIGSTPGNGATTFPTNGTLFVEFPASFSGFMAKTGAGSVTSTDNILLQATTNGAPSGSNLLVQANLSTSSTNHNSPNWLRVLPSSLTASTNYALTVKTTAQNSSGIGLRNNYMLFFKTASGADTTAPRFTAMTPASSTNGVALDTVDIVVQFGEDMAPPTITSTSLRLFIDNNGNYTLDAGESRTVSTTVRYDSKQKAAHIGLNTILTEDKDYCVEAGTTIKDIAGNNLVRTVQCFATTETVYTAVAPKIMFGDADNFKMSISFDRPIQPEDAVNKANYTIESPVGTTINLNAATFLYRPEARAVEISSIGLVTGQQFKTTVTSIRDISGGATITANGTNNVGKGVVLDSTLTGGNIGGLDKADFSATNFATFWQNPQRCATNSTIIGKQSRLTCEFPVPASLATGAQLILTFPTGFSIASSSLITAAKSPMNADLNGHGPGVTTLTAIATNTIANTITLTLAHTGTAMGSSDQLRFELDAITNPSNAGSYSVSIITKDENGVKQGQTINAAPFSVQAGGPYSVSGKVCKGTTSGGACGGDDTGISGAKVFMDSPASGHQETTSDGSGNYTFSSLTAGQYNIGLFIDPTVASSLGGGSNMQGVTITNASITAVDFKKADVSSSGKTLTVSITGSATSTDMDVFCFAPSNVQFSAPIMKQVTTDTDGVGSATLKVQPSSTYQCGIGPHIPFDSFSSGAAPTVPDFTFVPPEPKTVIIGTTDTSVSFVLGSASQQIKGKVTDGSGTAIASVYVDARPTGCFDTSTGAHKDCKGSFAQTKSDGSYTLKLTAGTYQVSACAPGLPCTTPTEVTVKTNSSNSDNNTTADIYTGGTLVTSANGVVLKMSKSSVTISGQVLDESSNAIQYAFVQAKKIGASDTCTSYTPQGGDTGSPTDSSGNYTLYVTNGTWRVEAFAGSYGQVGCSVITVSSDTSQSSKNIQATAAEYGTISGTVTKASTAVQGAQVNCFSTSGGNQTVSGSDGTFSMKVKAGTYRCDGFLSGSGPLTPATGVAVTSGATASVTLTIGNPATISVVLGSTVTDAFCDARDSTGLGGGTNQNSSGTYTLYVPAGTYTVRCGNPKIGEIGSESVVVTAGGTKTVTFSPPTLYTVSGSVTDGSNNLEGASVTFTDKTNGRSIFQQTNAASSGTNVSISLPAGTYAVLAGKAGYVDSDSAQTLTVSATATFTTRSLTKATATASVTVQSSSSNYTGEARVVATRSSDSKVVVASVDTTVTSGANVSLPLTTGTWSVVAYADNGKKSAAATIVVSGSSADTSPTLSLSTSITGFSAVQNQQSVTPSSGGLFKDANINSNFEVNIPSGALSTSDSTAGTIETKTNATLAISTPGNTFLGTSAIDITAKTSSGSKMTELASAATIKIPYSESDIPSGTSESQLQCATWNDTTQAWETLSTTVDTTNNVLTCVTDHFSTFGAIAPTSGGTTASTETTTTNGSSGGGGGAPVKVTLPKPSTGATVFAKVNGGAAESTTRAVTLNFSADNADQMAISNDPNFSGIAFQPYASSLNWQLTTGNGAKKVYVRFRSKDGGIVSTEVAVNLTEKDVLPTKTTPAPTSGKATSPAPTIGKSISAPSSVQFKKDLRSGNSGADVRALQIKLQELGYLDSKIVANGIYGPATTKAVKKFQAANKLSQVGWVGTQTRAKLNQLSTSVAPSAPTASSQPVSPAPALPTKSSSGIFTKNLSRGNSGDQVKVLQIKLQELGYLDSKIVANGIYGPATTNAVKKFQAAYKISQVGSLGPQTRAALNSLK